MGATTSVELAPGSCRAEHPLNASNKTTGNPRFTRYPRFDVGSKIFMAFVLKVTGDILPCYEDDSKRSEMLISIRLFLSRPANVEFSAIGLLSP